MGKKLRTRPVLRSQNPRGNFTFLRLQKCNHRALSALARSPWWTRHAKSQSILIFAAFLKALIVILKCHRRLELAAVHRSFFPSRHLSSHKNGPVRLEATPDLKYKAPANGASVRLLRHTRWLMMFPLIRRGAGIIKDTACGIIAASWLIFRAVTVHAFVTKFLSTVPGPRAVRPGYRKIRLSGILLYCKDALINSTSFWCLYTITP